MQRVGLIQMTSGSELGVNLAYLQEQVALLAQQGAQWIVTPENALLLGNREQYHQQAEPLDNGPVQHALSNLAKQHGVWLLIGSMPIRHASGVTTSSLLWNAQGERVAVYDKLHMFDVDVADGHQRYRESETFTPGQQVVVAETPFGQLGLSICYDVRFPHLYAELRRQGAQILLVPAAFTAVTGQAHWEVLLRARAIETQCWVIAVGQTGHHPCGRETWGHSMVISPWGEVIANLGPTVQSKVVEFDLTTLDSVRRAMPIERHTRFTHQLIENTH
ncbi:amidohydrolase [Vibrio metoecus]|uniref:carbon-nitrogen hydrolase family protein n=1 Tax=Vibrio metoecus TaxID=1481663 RepID=UPI0006D85803|nr:carbon-nitrogen hydrolase family protein [Vibrio metoecus]KQB01494.1 amidohydrolase [Vibrio metoecus]KQB07121.1 amidohydrolase [Vibrio metoecus]PAR51915.1 amidohydrolase [Vibrio metoecus]PAR56641.1 amidohydrolase [Vibrio metoecus]PAR60937.1 amidohydrolase [Vibrio metoecus]